MRRRTANSGFTLLELILALGMISMLAVSLYATLRVAFKARDSAMAGIMPMRAANVAMEMLSQDLESALPPTGLLAGAFLGQHLGDATASTDTIEFYCIGTSDSLEPPRSAGIRRVNIGLVQSPDGRGHLLVRRITSNLLSPQEVQPDEEVLCRNVRSFALRYFDGTLWQDEWDSTQMGDVLPMAVEVRMSIQTSEDSQAPTYDTYRVFTLASHKLPETTGGVTGPIGGGR
jgi:general secretion pathway protein J